MLLIAAAAPVGVYAQEQRLPAVTLGVVQDGPTGRRSALSELLFEELKILLELDFEVRTPVVKQIEGDFTVAGVERQLDALLADPEVDLILVSDPIGSHVAIHRTDLTKPVVAMAVLNAELQNAPRSGIGSGVTNLNYVAIKGSEEVGIYKETIPFTHLAVVGGATFFQLVPNLDDVLTRDLRNYGLEATLVPLADDVAATVASIGPDVDAVFLTPLIQIDQAQFAALIDLIHARGLPTFSWLGEIEVRQGVLAGTLPASFLQRVARRAALNVQRILLGDDAGTLPVDYPAISRLTINMKTARALGIEPNWKVLTEAELIDDEAPAAAQNWGLASSARQAIDTNLELRVQEQIVLAGAQDPNIANSVRLPQVGVGLEASFLDKDISRSTSGLLPERALIGSASLQQVIWDDSTWANVSIQNSLQEARVQSRDSVKLDITLEASVGYLEVLRAKTLERVQRENLILTRNNLEIARVRVGSGIATAQEVFRWENQIATNRRAVVNAQALRRILELQLNRTLNRPLEESFSTEDEDVDDADLLAGRQDVYDFLETPKKFEVLRNFMVQEAMGVSPELLAIDAATRAQTRQLTSTDRAFWSPTVTFDAGLQGFFFRGGEDFSAVATADPTDDYGSVNWSLGFNVLYPVFEGKARSAERDQAREEVSRLDFQRRVVMQRIDESVRSTLHRAQASLAGIELARDAATAARSNYDLVRLQYTRGTAIILDLLDAQNIAVTAEEDAANAVYEFLIDVMRVQRAVGRFDFTMTQAERDAFSERLEDFLRLAQTEAMQR